MLVELRLDKYSLERDVASEAPEASATESPKQCKASVAARGGEKTAKDSGLKPTHLTTLGEGSSRPRPHLPSAPGGCFGLGPPPPLLLPTAHGRAREPRAGEQGRLVREERQGAPPPSEPATPLWAAAASCAAASAGEWSALEFEQGPEPSQRHLRSRPPPPSSNSRSLRHSASHRPRAAVRPHSQSRGSLLKPPRRRRSPHAPAPAIGPAAAPDGSCSPGPRGPDTRSGARERVAGGTVVAGLTRPGSGASFSSRPCRETQVLRGRAGASVQAAVSIVSPPGTRRCLGRMGCAAAPGLLGPRPGIGEVGSWRLGTALSPARRRLAQRRHTICSVTLQLLEESGL
ncbi:translation initiation factor IF-2-like [Mustela erminea]|uniref:translation initiation factor IF-2-like n=1 Tax=Mustela erminea TaxID=36723 RepID=UPI001386EB6C|nr:translation initiation factor IF-2-like [Mustela erminea]